MGLLVTEPAWVQLPALSSDPLPGPLIFAPDYLPAQIQEAPYGWHEMGKGSSFPLLDLHCRQPQPHTGYGAS